MAQPGVLARMWRRTREISASSVEKLLEFSDDVRSKAKPLLDQAKEATGKAYEKAKEELRDLTDRAAPGAPKQ
jgi:hypothetical protein